MKTIKQIFLLYCVVLSVNASGQNGVSAGIRAGTFWVGQGNDPGIHNTLKGFELCWTSPVAQRLSITTGIGATNINIRSFEAGYLATSGCNSCGTLAVERNMKWIELPVGLSWRLTQSPEKAWQSHFMAGLVGGYLVSVKDNRWSTGHPETGPPDYLHVTMGGELGLQVSRRLGQGVALQMGVKQRLSYFSVASQGFRTHGLSLAVGVLFDRMSKK